MTDFRDAHKEDSSPPLPSLASPYLTGRCRPLGLVYSQPNQGFRGEFRGWMHLGLKGPSRNGHYRQRCAHKYRPDGGPKTLTRRYARAGPLSLAQVVAARIGSLPPTNVSRVGGSRFSPKHLHKQGRAPSRERPSCLIVGRAGGRLGRLAVDDFRLLDLVG